MEELFTLALRLFRPLHLLPNLIAGLVTGTIVVSTAISYAALIFSGELAAYRSLGIGYALYSVLSVGLILFLLNAISSGVVKPQDTPAAILAVMAGAIAANLPATAGAHVLFATMVITIALSSLATGILFLVLGSFRLGNLVRYVPYPVIGGYLAGVGWLLTMGAMRVMTETPFALRTLPQFVLPPLLWRWLPGVLFSITLLLVERRLRHPLTIPAMIVGAILLFYAALHLAGVSLAEASAHGWMLGPFAEAVEWRPLSLSLLAQADWLLILGQVGSIGTIALISSLDFLLMASGLELVVRRDINLDRGLRAVGIGNLLAGLGGGMVGFPSQSTSTLGYLIGGGSRLTGVVAVLVCGVVLWAGTETLSYFPKPVLGGLLFYLGLGYLVRWLYEGWFTLSRIDYLIVLLILLVINVWGIVAGVGLGVALSSVLFVVRYSRVPVVKQELSGRTYRSHVDRPPAEVELLRQQAGRIAIFQLQGFLFFGTANRVLERVQHRLATSTLPALRFLIFDLRQVGGMDGSALLGFSHIVGFARKRGIEVLFTDVTVSTQARLGRLLRSEQGWHLLPDLDRGVEWCEAQLLDESRQQKILLPDLMPNGQFDAILPPALLRQLDCRELQPGEYLIRIGDPSRGIFFLESGRLTAQLEYGDGRIVRLRSMRAGAIIGEIGFYTEQAASASVVANEPSCVRYLPAETLVQFAAVEPESVARFHRALARLASERLLDATATVRTLMA
jgi:sulfate permease, SulP family